MSWIDSSWLLALAFWLLTADLAHAGVNQWTSNGPAERSVFALAVDPKAPAIVYGGTDQGVFKSIDSGGNWTATNNGLPNFLPTGAIGITALVIDPLTPSTVYAGGGHLGWIFKSTDGGANWAIVAFLGRSITTLAIDPFTPTTVYAASDGIVFKSIDGGANWSRMAELAIMVTALIVDPISPTTVYAGLSNSTTLFGFTIEGGGVAKSTDGGVTWALTNTTDLSISAVTIDPKTPSTIYASFRTSGPPYRSGLFGVVKSTDGGDSWTTSSFGLTAVRTLILDPTHPTTLYAGTADGVLQSTDSGTNWTSINSGLPAVSVQVLAIDPISSTLHAGTNSGVFDLQIIGTPQPEILVMSDLDRFDFSGAMFMLRVKRLYCQEYKCEFS
jgi:hypothetical protein